MKLVARIFIICVLFITLFITLYVVFGESFKYDLKIPAGTNALPTDNPNPQNGGVGEPKDTEDRPLEASTGGGELVTRGGPGSEYAGHFTVPANQTVQILGQYDGCHWLQIGVGDQGEAWIEAQWLALPDEFDCAGLPAGTYQPQTGVLTRPDGHTGLGELTIENGSTFDGIAILTTADDQPVVSAYIRDGDTFKIDRIPDGSYLLYFSGGEGWNGSVFTEHASFQRFDELFPFFTSDRSYSIWSVTLHPVVGGDAQAEDVDPDQFPAIGQ